MGWMREQRRKRKRGMEIEQRKILKLIQKVREVHYG